MKVKICGQTSVHDCELSLGFGADFLGVVTDVKSSPRSVSHDRAEEIMAKFRDRTFLLTLDREPDKNYINLLKRLSPYAIQLTGMEPFETVALIHKTFPDLLIYKSLHLPPAGEGSRDIDISEIVDKAESYRIAGANGFVLDTAAKGLFGGTGEKNDWVLAGKIVKQFRLPTFIAGGIDPDNCLAACAIEGIYGIDMASGVERAKGEKSPEKIGKLFAQLRKAGLHD